MSDNILEFKQGGSWTPPSRMFRGQLTSDGNPIWEEVDMDSYIVPPSGDYDLRMVGFSYPTDEPISEQFRKSGGPTHTKKTSVELEIISDRGKGFRFLWNFVTYSLSLAKGKNPSHLGRVYKAAVLKGEDLPPDRRTLFTELIGQDFHAYVKAEGEDEDGNPKYCKLVPDTIRKIDPKGAKGYDPFNRNSGTPAPDPEPQQELVAAAPAAPKGRGKQAAFDESVADVAGDDPGF